MGDHVELGSAEWYRLVDLADDLEDLCDDDEDCDYCDETARFWGPVFAQHPPPNWPRLHLPPEAGITWPLGAEADG